MLHLFCFVLPYIFLCFFLYNFMSWPVLQVSLVGALIALLKLYLGSVLVLLSEGLYTEKSMSGKLSGWLKKLTAFPVEMDFSSQSSEGCLSLRSPMFTSFTFST